MRVPGRSPPTRTVCTNSSAGSLRRIPAALLAARHPVDTLDRLGVGADHERHTGTGDRERIAADIVDGVAGKVIVAVERDACGTAPQPRLHLRFTLSRTG